MTQCKLIFFSSLKINEKRYLKRVAVVSHFINRTLITDEGSKDFISVFNTKTNKNTIKKWSKASQRVEKHLLKALAGLYNNTRSVFLNLHFLSKEQFYTNERPFFAQNLTTI